MPAYISNSYTYDCEPQVFFVFWINLGANRDCGAWDDGCPCISGSPAGMERPPLGRMMRRAFIPYGGSRSRHPRLAVLVAHRGRTPPVDLATLKILRRGQTGLWPGFRVPNAVVEHTGGQQEGKAMRAERRAVARQIDNVRDSAPDDARERCRWVRAGIIQEDRESVGSRQRLVAKPGGGGTELQSREPRPTSVRPSHCSRAAENDLVRFEAMPEPRARPN